MSHSTDDEVKNRPATDAAWVLETRTWAQQQSRRLAVLCIVLVGLLAGSLLANIIQSFARPGAVYFALTPDLRVVRLAPMNHPLLSDAGVVSWTTRTVVETFSLDFLHWRATLSGVRGRYTSRGFSQLTAAMKKSGNIEQIVNKRMSVNVSPSSAGVVANQGMLNGVYAWKVQVPLAMSYETSQGVVYSQKLIANVMVVRADPRKHPAGIAIVQLVLSPDTTTATRG